MMNRFFCLSLVVVVVFLNVFPAVGANKLPTLLQLFVDLYCVENGHVSGCWKWMENIYCIFYQVKVCFYFVLILKVFWEYYGFIVLMIYDEEEKVFKMWYSMFIVFGCNVMCYVILDDGIYW